MLDDNREQPIRRSEPGKTPGKAEGDEQEEHPIRSEPGKTPGQAEGDVETEKVNLGV